MILIIKFDHETKKFSLPMSNHNEMHVPVDSDPEMSGICDLLNIPVSSRNGSSWVSRGPMGAAEVSPSSLTSIRLPQW